jgi:hypothetical protein
VGENTLFWNPVHKDHGALQMHVPQHQECLWAPHVKPNVEEPKKQRQDTDEGQGKVECDAKSAVTEEHTEQTEVVP